MTDPPLSVRLTGKGNYRREFVSRVKERVKFWVLIALGIIEVFGVSLLFALALGPQQATSQQQPPQSTQQNAPAQQNSSSPLGQSAAPASSGNAPATGSAPPSPQEAQDYNAIEKETDPDKQLQLVKDFEKKYPNSSLLSDAYFFGASAAERKNDVTHALDYGQKSLKLRPDNLRSLILVASLLPLPQALQGTDQKKEQQLDESENDANHALQLLNNVQRQPQIPEAQFDKNKALIQAQLHAALGMAHLEKAVMAPKSPDANELASAEQEFKAAVQSPEPSPQDYYRLGEVYVRENKLDDAINAFTQAAKLGQGTLIQQYANNMIEKLKAAKAKSSNSSPADQQQ